MVPNFYGVFLSFFLLFLLLLFLFFLVILHILLNLLFFFLLLVFLSPSDSLDYTAASGIVTFSSSLRQQCVDITIVDDNVFESLETFTVNINTSVERVVFKNNITMVEIVDDGEKDG